MRISSQLPTTKVQCLSALAGFACALRVLSATLQPNHLHRRALQHPLLAQGSFLRDSWFVVVPAALVAFMAAASMLFRSFPALCNALVHVLYSHRRYGAGPGLTHCPLRNHMG